MAPGRGEHGTALLACANLTARPVEPGTWNAQAIARLDVPGALPAEVTAVHPPAPLDAARVRAWGTDLAHLPAAAPDGIVRILVGDFNATLDHEPLRDLIDTGYRDVADALGDGLRATWPVGRRGLGVTIDHVLVDERCGVRRLTLHEMTGNDHRALIADVVLPSL